MSSTEIGFNEEGEDIKVCGVLRDNGACGLYRIRQPISYVNEEKGIDAAIGGVDCRDNDLFDLLEQCDVAVIPRAANEQMIEMIDVLHKMTPRKKVIVDHDDNIFEINPLSPHYKDMGTEDIVVELDGKKLTIWQDGKGQFDIERNKKKVAAAKKCLEMADAVSVTTEELKKFYSQFNDNVFVLPNSIDFSIWQPVKMVNDGLVRITWHGGCSHYQDLVEIGPTLTSITKRHKKVKLEICGHEFKGIFKDVNRKQYQFHRWVATPAHPYKQMLLNADIAVIPLKDDLFNVCKSPIKWIEYSALNIPSVMKNIPPYSEVVEHGVTGFLYNTPEECEYYIEKLIADPVLRGRVGKAARMYVTENFNAQTNASLWADAMKQIMEEPCLSLQ
jgi:glycosyltransferase involved in cell wall biosynthesis